MNPLLQAIARLILVPIFIIAAAVLVKGYSSPGDGFSAGILAATGILIQYLVFGAKQSRKLFPIRLAHTFALVGLLVVLVLGFLPVMLGHPVLTHFPRPEEEVVYLGTLELHTALLMDLCIFMIVLGFSTCTIDLLAERQMKVSE